MVMFIFFSFFICVFFEPDEGPGSGSKCRFCYKLKLIMEPLPNYEMSTENENLHQDSSFSLWRNYTKKCCESFLDIMDTASVRQIPDSCMVA